MEIWEAIIMGMVQGATEFLPVSSDGHLVLFSQLLGTEPVTGAFSALLHLATTLAVFLTMLGETGKIAGSTVGMGQDIRRYLEYRKQKKAGVRLPRVRVIQSDARKLLLLILAALPWALLTGLLLSPLLPAMMEGGLTAGIGFLMTGCILVLGDLAAVREIPLKNYATANSVLIGIGQGLSLIPGISGIAMLYAIGRVTGMKVKTAIRYYFLLSMPLLLGFFLFQIPALAQEPWDGSLVAAYLLGMLAAFLIGLIMIRVFFYLLSRVKVRYFSYYLIAAGCAAILCYLF